MKGYGQAKCSKVHTRGGGQGKMETTDRRRGRGGKENEKGVDC